MKVTTSKFIDDLRLSMRTQFISVNKATNPIYLDKDSLSYNQLLHLLQEYTFFSKYIVPFLLDANLIFKYHGLNTLSNEIVLNVTEELGNHVDHDLDNKYNGVPHYVLLRKGFSDAIDYDITYSQPSNATDLFIKGVKMHMNNNNPMFVAGSTFALESTATNELEMVYEYTKRFFSILVKPVPDPIVFYFESHINEIEIEHENRLRDACSVYLNSQDAIIQFKNGFYTVLTTMDNWWKGLYEEMINTK